MLAAALLLAAGLGLLLALMLVAMLQHVFDPPPDQLAVPWGYLGELAGAAVAGDRSRGRDRGAAAAAPAARTAAA